MLVDTDVLIWHLRGYAQPTRHGLQKGDALIAATRSWGSKSRLSYRNNPEQQAPRFAYECIAATTRRPGAPSRSTDRYCWR
jgi:hypothetical protein